MNARREISIDLLDFDLKNPRLTTDATTQKTALQGILENEASSCIDLLKDIVEHGIAPNDIPFAFQSKNGRYIVIEGNRRLLALKLLKGDTEALNQLDDNQRKKVQKITKDATPISEIEVEVVQDRKEAEHWISLKHESGNDGAAARSWKPFEKARHEFTKDPSRCDPALALFYYAQKLAKDNHELESNVRRIHDKQFSTLHRIVNSSHFTKLTGISFEGARINAAKGQAHLDGIVAGLFATIGTNEANSRTLNKENEIKAFLEDFCQQFEKEATNEPVFVDTEKRNSRPQDRKDTEPSEKPVQEDLTEVTEAALANEVTESQKSSPKKPLEGLTFQNIGEPEVCLLDEVKRLSFRRHPHLVAAGYRIILDLATQRFEGEIPEFVFKSGSDLDDRVCQIIDYIEPEAMDRKTRVQRWSSIKGYRAQMDSKPLKTLQLSIHGKNVTMLPNTVEKLDPLVHAILVAIDEKIRQDYLL